MRDEQLKQEDMFDQTAGVDDIIDEEELVLLRQMKDLKKIYRDSFQKLKSLKLSYSDNQSQIDVTKELLISKFEQWYASEFDVPSFELENAYNAAQQTESKDMMKADSVFGGSNQEDEDQQTFMRAKRKVETLARAKRDDRRIGIAAK